MLLSKSKKYSGQDLRLSVIPLDQILSENENFVLFSIESPNRRTVFSGFNFFPCNRSDKNHLTKPFNSGSSCPHSNSNYLKNIFYLLSRGPVKICRKISQIVIIFCWLDVNICCDYYLITIY